MIEILYIIMMYTTLRPPARSRSFVSAKAGSFEWVAQIFNSSSIHTHQQVVGLYTIEDFLRTSVGACQAIAVIYSRSPLADINYGGKSELYPVSRDIERQDGHSAG